MAKIIDSELAQAFRQAREGSPSELLVRYERDISPKIRRLFQNKVPDGMEIDDLINEVAVRLGRSNGSKNITQVEDLMRYCVTIAQNIVRDGFRRHYREYRFKGPSFDDDEAGIDVGVLPLDYEMVDRFRDIETAVPLLLPNQKYAIQLTARGTIGRNAAQKLQMGYGNYRELLWRARQTLRELTGHTKRNS